MMTFILLWVMTGLVGLLVLSIRRRRRWARINRDLLRSMERTANELQDMMVLGTFESMSYGLAGLRRPPHLAYATKIPEAVRCAQQAQSMMKVGRLALQLLRDPEVK